MFIPAFEASACIFALELTPAAAVYSFIVVVEISKFLHCVAFVLGMGFIDDDDDDQNYPFRFLFFF